MSTDEHARGRSFELPDWAMLGLIVIPSTVAFTLLAYFVWLWTS